MLYPTERSCAGTALKTFKSLRLLTFVSQLGLIYLFLLCFNKVNKVFERIKQNLKKQGRQKCVKFGEVRVLIRESRYNFFYENRRSQ